MNLDGLPARLFAGTSRVEITPVDPISMGGYGQRAEQTSLGVHDPLFAKALFLTDGRERRHGNSQVIGPAFLPFAAFARIFLQNSCNLGLRTIICPTSG